MNKPIHRFFTQDHRRIDLFLEKATQDSNAIDLALYKQFRVGLLTHIKMEENLLFPATKAANKGKPLPNFKQFRLEHAALTTLLAVHPNAEIITVLKKVLERHDKAEEIPGGMYDVCEKLTQPQTEELLEKLQKTPPVPVHPPKKNDFVLQAAKRVLTRAGYEYDDLLI